MLLRASESGVRGHRQVLSGVNVNIDGSEVVWRSQPRAISRYALEAGSARLAQKMDTYITSNMAKLLKMLERRDISEPNHVRTCTYLLLFRSEPRRLFESGVYFVPRLLRYDYYSRAAFIRERHLFGLIRYVDM